MYISRMTVNLLTCCVLLVAGAAQVQAQTIYRFIGPDGKVTFSDKPPADVAKATATSASGKPVPTSTDAGLPYELRQVVARYPVTLYSSATCVPCNSGRMLLQSRGIPFTELTVTTNEDVEALQRISGANSLPFLTIGGQKIKGFAEAEWTQFLSAANYPTTSLLPASYRNPPSKPLVALQAPPPIPVQAQAQQQEDVRDAPAAEAPAAVSSPGGIRF